jgi:predicted RNA-binding protein YlxR (DUF448 family)
MAKENQEVEKKKKKGFFSRFIKNQGDCCGDFRIEEIAEEEVKQEQKDKAEKAAEK